MTGDIGDGHVADLKNEVSPLSKLSSMGRLFYVPGNHEYYWDVDAWLAEFTTLGAKVLLNKGESFQFKGKKIWVGGVTDPTATLMNKEMAPDAAHAAQGSEDSIFKLLLSHRPGLAHDASVAGFDLQLSGHTHGGQFFPWTIVAKLFHEYCTGLGRHDKMWIYTSPGTGWWGPPVRIGTSSEVTVLKLIEAQ